MIKFDIPADCLVLDLKPSDLNEVELSSVVYSRWYLVNDARFGDIILISASDIGALGDKMNPPEFFGYNNIKSVRIINDIDKKWDNDKFFV